jgi:hypothetical protein
LDGMRLRDFRAGPARATSQSFSSAEFMECNVITALVCSPPATNGSQFGWGGGLLCEVTRRDVCAERFPDDFGASPMLRPHGFLDLLRHVWRECNGDGLTCAHESLALPDNAFT